MYESHTMSQIIQNLKIRAYQLRRGIIKNRAQPRSSSKKVLFLILGKCKRSVEGQKVKRRNSPSLGKTHLSVQPVGTKGKKKSLNSGSLLMLGQCGGARGSGLREEKNFELGT